MLHFSCNREDVFVKLFVYFLPCQVINHDGNCAISLRVKIENYSRPFLFLGNLVSENLIANYVVSVGHLLLV